jgi:hypothetical protein
MKAILAILVVGIIGYFVYAAVKPDKKPLKTGTKEVYYYPKANVYYDVATAQYAFFEEAEKKWKLSKDFSEEQKLSLGEKAVITHPSSPIWKNNTQDRLIYSVNVYASSKDLKQKLRTDSLNSIPSPKVVVSPPKDGKQEERPEEEKPKSGFRKFFDKIFKGKDKEKEKES